MEFESNLIVKIKEFECLWSKSDKIYKNMVLKEKIWANIASELNTNVESVKARWKSLRDIFVREEKKIASSSTSGSAAPEQSTWQYYQEMLFLKAHCQRRPTVTNFSSTSLETLQNSDTADITADITDNSRDLESGMSEETPARFKRSRLDARFNDMLDKVEAMCSPAQPSRHASFATYLCERLELLPLSVARSLEVEIQARVHNVIDEYENANV